MDPKEIMSLIKEFGWFYSLAFILISFIGGMLSYYLTKLVDSKLGIEAKRKEEIREIRRKRYEEFIVTIEKMLARKNDMSPKAFLDELNLVYAQMFISVPDSIVKVIKEEINNNFDANKRKRIYLEIRKDLLGKTDVKEDELCYFVEKK